MGLDVDKRDIFRNTYEMFLTLYGEKQHAYMISLA